MCFLENFSDDGKYYKFLSSNFKKQSNRVANIFSQKGGYTMSDKTSAALSFHTKKYILWPARVEKTIELNSQCFVNDSEPPV